MRIGIQDSRNVLPLLFCTLLFGPCLCRRLTGTQLQQAQSISWLPIDDNSVVFPVADEAGFVSALTNTSVDTVLVVVPELIVSESAWEGFTTPIVIRRNVTIQGSVQVGSWPVIRSYARRKVELTAYTNLMFVNVILDPLRNNMVNNLGQIPGFDLLARTAAGTSSALLILKDTAFVNAVCYPTVGMREQNFQWIVRPAYIPGEQRANLSIPQPGCINSTAVPYLDRCWGDRALLADAATPSADANPSSALPEANNYDIWFLDALMLCKTKITMECVEKLGPVGCLIFMANNDPSNKPSPPPPSLASSAATGTAQQQQQVTGVANTNGSQQSPEGASRSPPPHHGVIVAIVVGATAGAALLAGLAAAAFCYRRRRALARGGLRAKGSSRNGDHGAGRGDFGLGRQGGGAAAAAIAPFSRASRAGGGPAMTLILAPLPCNLKAKTRTVVRESPDTATGQSDGPLTLTGVGRSAGGQEDTFNPSVDIQGEDSPAATAAAPSFASPPAVITRGTPYTPCLDLTARIHSRSRGDNSLESSATTGVDCSAPHAHVLTAATGATGGGSTDGGAAAAGDAVDPEVVELLGVRRGVGTFGQVQEGMYRGQRVAVKLAHLVITAEGAAAAGMATHTYDWLLRSLMQEVEVLGRCRHPNIVRLLAACVRPPRLGLVLELMETSLDQLLHTCRRRALLPMRLVLHIAIEVARGLEYLHPTIVHRDLKPGNVLINDPWGDRPVVKIADFGLSRLRETTIVTQHPAVGTPAYMAPECFDTTTNAISHQADIYSFGVLLWEMLSGVQPWGGVDPLEVAVRVCMRHLRPPLPPPHLAVASVRWQPVLRILVNECWDPDPRRRPAAAELAKQLELVRQAHAHLSLDKQPWPWDARPSDYADRPAG